MNLKKIQLFFILLSISIYGQNYRYSYEYSFKLDSLNKNIIESEIMNLDITKEGSIFYSNVSFVADSLIQDRVNKQINSNSTIIDFGKISNNSKVDFSVTKKYGDSQIILHTSINGDKYAIEENEKIFWTIHPDIQEIEGFKVQKATSNFIGRNWIAWFTTEIQFQDGPYKFHGLPGLILNLHDTSETHIFKLIGIKKIFVKPLTVNSTNKNEITISPEKFKELWKIYLNDPTRKLRNLYSDSFVKITIRDPSGKELTPSEVMRNREKNIKEKLKRTNNFLDMTLYK